MMERFQDRAEAGRLLAERLSALAGRDDVLVLALPRGGVPVAAEVARALKAPLDVLVVRKLGAPGHEELAVGAIAMGGVRVLDERVIATLRVPVEAIDEVAQREQRELERRERAYRGDRPPPDVAGRTVVVVDDGLATGSTMKAALKALRELGPGRLVAAVPVAPPDTCREVGELADEVHCLNEPPAFSAVGTWYRDFSQTSDDEVRGLLEDHHA